MTANKHTPGPWVVNQRPREPFEYGHHVMTEDGLTICSVTYQLPSRTPEGVEETKRIANARLIAAAPELLLALTKKVEDAEQRAFEDWLESNSPSGDHEQVQRQWLESNDHRGFIGEWREQLDAIAKATGASA